MEVITDFGARVRIENRYLVRCWRVHPDGVLFSDGHRRRLVWADEFKNLVPTVGLEHLLRRGILGQTLPTFNDGTLDAVHGRRYPDGRRTPRAWTTGTKAVGDVCQPASPGANGRMYLCTVGGASGGSQPSFPTTAGASVTDGSATWIEASLLYVGLKGQGTPAATDRMDSHASWSEITTYSESARPAFNPAAATSGSTDSISNPASVTLSGTATIYGAFLTDFPTKGGTSGLILGVGDFSSPKSGILNDVVQVSVVTSIS